MPSSMPMNMPKSVMFLICPSILVPTGYFSPITVQGFTSVCLRPREMRRLRDVDTQDHGLDLVPDLEDFRRMPHPPGPGHFGNVNQPLDPFFKGDEGAVVGEADDLAADPRTDLVFSLDGQPGIGHGLLESQGNFPLDAVVFQHHHVDLVADLDHLGRMVQPPPGHVGDVQQTVKPAQIDECAVIGDVLDDPFEDLPFRQIGQGFLFQDFPVFFQEHPAGKDDVAALAVHLEDLELAGLADVPVQIAAGTDVDL